MLHIVRTVSIAALLAVLFVTFSIRAICRPIRRSARSSFSYVARTSKAGKAAIAALDAFGKQKSLEVEAKAAELQKQQVELQKSGIDEPARRSPICSARSRNRASSSIAFNRTRRRSIEAMQTKFDAEFRVKLAPIVDEISKEKGLHFVFGIEQAAIVWWSPAVDISDEVVKRLDAVEAHQAPCTHRRLT